MRDKTIVLRIFILFLGKLEFLFEKDFQLFMVVEQSRTNELVDQAD